MIPYNKIINAYGAGIVLGGGKKPLGDYFYITNTETSVDIGTGANVRFKKRSATSPNRDLEYSYDQETWNKVEFPEGGTECKVPIHHNERVYIRNNDSILTEDASNYMQITVIGHAFGSVFKVGGVLGSLWNDKETNTFTNNYCAAYLFNSFSALEDASELIMPNNTTPYCCYNMFNGGNNFAYPPVLPATEIANWAYAYMFYNCKKMVTPPSLPATTLGDGAYNTMFKYCLELQNVPKINSTDIGSNTYAYMFQGCTKLKVYAEPGDGHNVPWTIPANGTFSGTTNPSNMFYNVITDSVPATPEFNAGESVTYYVENEPV